MIYYSSFFILHLYDVDTGTASTITAQKYVNGNEWNADYAVMEGKVTATVDRFTPDSGENLYGNGGRNQGT